MQKQPECTIDAPPSHSWRERGGCERTERRCSLQASSSCGAGSAKYSRMLSSPTEPYPESRRRRTTQQTSENHVYAQHLPRVNGNTKEPCKPAMDRQTFSSTGRGPAAVVTAFIASDSWLEQLFWILSTKSLEPEGS